ncbi:hypothetical protein MLD38_011717 [Melastoma candidum]|uniref:Uncharacterized protein n=1 Tax=Melastoma candidum TaxID=119954 RepID=A0ACB9R7H1_9MYRT|nr:hypothetical protein MLD38_011717 [Melastoma candidum]
MSQGGGGGGKLMPNLDHHGTKLLNLTVLQRIDPFVEEILITAAHVTFYEFNIDSSQWSRKDVEGSLFVVKRNAQPRFQFIVMNRRSTDNLVENLLEDFEFEVQVPYLLYRNAAQEVNGIWFYNARECEEVASLFNRILNAYSKVPQKSKVSSTKSEFEELEAVPTMAIMDGPLEPPSSSPTNVSDVPDDPAFIDFFSSSLNVGNAPNAGAVAQPYQPPTIVAPPPGPPPVVQPVAPPLRMQSPPLTAPAQSVSFIDGNDATSKTNLATNLVKPSFFIPPPASSAPVVPPVSSSIPTAPLLHTPVHLQRPYGAPILQPFPPPVPPPSLTPASFPVANYGPPIINRDKVREALLVLVEDNQFVDMVYRVLLNAHNS